MPFKSSRPIYAIILFALSVIYMCTTFLPLLYSLLFPNEDIEQVVAALKEAGPAPLDAENVVQEAKSAVGPLTKAIQVGSGYTLNKGFHLSGAHEETSVRETAYVYIAWFEKRSKPMLVSIALYANDAGQKAYQISEVNGMSVVRAYAIPVLLFAVSLFLMSRRKSSRQTSWPSTR